MLANIPDQDDGIGGVLVCCCCCWLCFNPHPPPQGSEFNLIPWFIGKKNFSGESFSNLLWNSCFYYQLPSLLFKTTVPFLVLTQYRNANVASADSIDHFCIPILVLRACAWQRVWSRNPCLIFVGQSVLWICILHVVDCCKCNIRRDPITDLQSHCTSIILRFIWMRGRKTRRRTEDQDNDKKRQIVIPVINLICLFE